MTDPYTDPETGILKNKLDIKDAQKLEKAERALTVRRIVELREKNLGEINFQTLQNIHREIFQDIYEWAGKPRTVDISKQNTYFCRNGFIENEAKNIFDKVRKANNYKGLSAEDFCGKAADLFCDVNMLHPFREGNGRAQRELIYHLAKNAGYELDLTKANKETYMAASIVGTVRSENMVNLMKSVIRPIHEKRMTPKKKLTISPKPRGKAKNLTL